MNYSMCFVAIWPFVACDGTGGVAAAAAAGHRGTDQAPDLAVDLLEAYRELPAYADRGRVSARVLTEGRAREFAGPSSLAFVRPDRLVVEAGAVGVFRAGTALRVVDFSHRVVYAYEGIEEITTDRADVAGADESVTLDAIEAILRRPPSDPGLALEAVGWRLVNFPLSLMLAGEPMARADWRITEDDRGGDGAGGGTLLRLERPGWPTFGIRVDPATHLIRRIELRLEGQDLGALLGAPGRASEVTITWDAGAITTDPVVAARVLEDRRRGLVTRMRSFQAAARGGVGRHRAVVRTSSGRSTLGQVRAFLLSLFGEDP